ncbi:hypothetical protein JXL21_03805 [Candidatus Bathyarchaeota archaeon]|nr:hypothetical protein [Candidatus Bathyarchaeota archaeon]
MIEEITFTLIFQFLQTVSICVGVFYYIITIRTNQQNQRLTLDAQQQSLETRQAQLFMQLHNRMLDELKSIDQERLMLNKLSGFDEYLEKYENDKEFRDSFNTISNFYEGIGVMVKEGYLTIRLIALMWSNMTIRYWKNVLEPSLEGIREYYGSNRVWSEAEYLCRELIKYHEEHPELAAY